MLLAQTTQLKAKLLTKGKHRPHKMVRKKEPDGSGMLTKPPTRNEDVEDTVADKQYCDDVDQVANGFGRQKRSNHTADEHRAYTRRFQDWLSRKGFGVYFVAELDKFGGLVEVRCKKTRDAHGRVVPKVVKPQFIIGWLLDMAAASPDAPKGGHADDIKARAGEEAPTAEFLRHVPNPGRHGIRDVANA